MCPPNDQFCGCEVMFVDTAFFDRKNGRVIEMILTNKEGFVYSIKKEKRLKFFKIQKHFNEVVRERRRAQPPINRDSYDEDPSFFDRQTTGFNNRTTFGSELISDAIKNMATGAISGLRGTLNGSAGRERSSTDFLGVAKLGQSVNGGGRSTFVSQARDVSSYTKKSTNNESTKKVERQDFSDWAIFRFEVEPESLPMQASKGGGMNTTIQTGFEDQTAISTLDGAAQNNGRSENGTQMTTYRTKNDGLMSKPSVRVVNEKVFNNMMIVKASSRQWRALECI